MKFKTIYLTGAPAAGKSTLTKTIQDSLPELEIWEYGARLTQYLSELHNISLTQDELRSSSATIVTPADIQAVDGLLQDWVEGNRRSKHLLIDSHPVTKESYGFRITAFKMVEIERLAPDELWMFYVPPEIAIQRIEHDNAGRPQIDIEQSRMHTMLQASVISNYAIGIGRPVYMFDSNVPRDVLASALLKRFQKP